MSPASDSLRRAAHAAVAVLGMLAGSPVPAGATDQRPSWECLPAETAAVLRVPQGRAFAEALAARTKFGAVMLAPARWARVRERLAAFVQASTGDADGGLEGLVARLGEYGLREDDLPHLLDGPAGAAIVPGTSGWTMVLAWLEPGAAAAERMLDGIDRFVAEQLAKAEAEAGRPTRTDLDMAGRRAMWMSIPVLDDGRRLRTAHLFVTRSGGRLLAAVAVVPNRLYNVNVNIQAGADGRMNVKTTVTERPGQAEAAATAEREAEEEIRTAFERFLARHDGDEPAAVAEWLDVPGVRDALPGGIPLLEIVARPLAAAGVKNPPASLTRYGFDAVGPLVWRQSLDGDVLRSHVFVSLPAPRRGLLRIVDAPADPTDVPSFVTRETACFRQISLDLGRAYALVRETLLDGDEPPPGNAFGTLESQCLAVLGAELPAVLGGLGTRHWMLSFPTNIPALAARMRKLRTADEAAAAGADASDAPLALVWEVKDADPFQKVLQLAASAARVEPAEEQGFRTVRFPGGVSLALGPKHLVVAVGAGLAEKILAGLRNPPAADAALAGSEIMRRAHELLPAEPGGYYSVGDLRATGGWIGTLGALSAAIAAEEAGGDGKPASAIERAEAAVFREILPSDAEREGLVGVATTLWQATADGILLRSVTELPPP